MTAVTLLIENIALVILIICGMWNTRQIGKLRDRVHWLESPTHGVCFVCGIVPKDPDGRGCTHDPTTRKYGRA